MISYPQKPVPRRDTKLIGKSWVSLTAAIAFVPVKHAAGYGTHTPLLYVKTHPCVVLVKCPLCNVRAGTLCLSRHAQPTVTCHAVRKTALKRARRRT